MTRLGPLLAAAGAAVLALTACAPGDDPGPNYSSVSPTASASTSASPFPTGSPTPTVPTTGPNVSPGEKPPVVPADVDEESSSGAIAFVGYYVKTLDWVYATTRPDLLSPFYAAACGTCRDGQGAIEQFAATGVIKGGRLMIKQIALVTNDRRGGAAYAVSVNYSVSAASVITTSGATATSFPAGDDVTLTEWVAWTGGRWQIVEERYA